MFILKLGRWLTQKEAFVSKKRETDVGEAASGLCHSPPH